MEALEKQAVLYRTVNFEIRPTPVQTETLKRISSHLRQVWNKAHAERQDLFDRIFAPMYVALKATAVLKDQLQIKKQIKEAFGKHRITFYDQVNHLTRWRADPADPEFSLLTRDWQEEILRTLQGSFSSFMVLRKKGDLDAKPPRIRREGHFTEISGRFGFKVTGNSFRLSCGKIAGDSEFSFAIPDYQLHRMERMTLKKFTLYRDERDLTKPGRYWVSIACETKAPELEPFSPDQAVYVALGASSIGILSPIDEEVVQFWRPDKYWQPRIESVKNRMDHVEKKGSRKWRRLNQARRKMERLKSRQQKLNHRQIVDQKLLPRGIHFVVTEMVVRSKPGKLADSRKTERGGTLGLNWAAQNTGSISELVLWLEEKVREYGGTVRRHKLSFDQPPEKNGRDDKIIMARLLRQSFLDSLSREPTNV